MPGRFIDTNVLIYVASTDPAKAERAEEIVGEGGAISVQVLKEFAHVARRKMRMSWGETRALLEILRGLLPVHPLTTEIHETAVRVAERHNLSIYDGMIAASALHADCETLLSEDMQDGLVIEDRLRIVNPFR
jgi:predicted nucleic acid-binding protein